MTPFDRVTETTERARRRLSKDAEIDEIAMDCVLQRAEGREKQGVDKRQQPRESRAHGCGR
jgi:hypothetical protein